MVELPRAIEIAGKAVRGAAHLPAERVRLAVERQRMRGDRRAIGFDQRRRVRDRGEGIPCGPPETPHLGNARADLTVPLLVLEALPQQICQDDADPQVNPGGDLLLRRGQPLRLDAHGQLDDPGMRLEHLREGRRLGRGSSRRSPPRR